jgi:hypothetical protein
MASLTEIYGEMPDGEEPEVRQLRAARNQSLFREVNERVEELSANLNAVIAGDFVCECADTACTERIELTIPEYEALRAHPDHFAVRPGHVYPDVEQTVEEYATYTVVAMLGHAALYAIQVDPRATV